MIDESELEETIGTKLATFCQGSPTYWLNEVPAGTLQQMEEANRQKRRIRKYLIQLMH